MLVKNEGVTMRDVWEVIDDKHVRIGNEVYPLNIFTIIDDWIIFKMNDEDALAYHRKGSIVLLHSIKESDYKKSLSKINVKWPCAEVNSPTKSPEYVFYVREDGTISRDQGCTFVSTSDPEKALKNVIFYYEYMHVLPSSVSDTYACREFDGVDICFNFVEKHVKINHNPEIIIPFDRLEREPIKPQGFTFEHDEDTETSVWYKAGLPYRVSKKNYFMITRNEEESTEEFMKIIDAVRKMTIVDGYPPYRADLNPFHTTAWIKLGDRIIEVSLPYGKTLKGNFEYVRRRAVKGYYSVKDWSRRAQRLLQKLGDECVIKRVFEMHSPIIFSKKTEKYILIGTSFPGVKAKSIEEALEKFSCLNNEKDKTGKATETVKKKDETENVDAQDVIEIVYDYDSDYDHSVTVRYSQENLKKARKIVNILRKDYEKTWLFPPVSVRHYIQKIINDVSSIVDAYEVVHENGTLVGVRSLQNDVLIPLNYTGLEGDDVSLSLQFLFHACAVPVTDNLKKVLEARYPVEYLQYNELMEGQFLYTRKYDEHAPSAFKLAKRILPLPYLVLFRDRIFPRVEPSVSTIVLSGLKESADPNYTIEEFYEDVPQQETVEEEFWRLFKKEGLKEFKIRKKEVFEV